MTEPNPTPPKKPRSAAEKRERELQREHQRHSMAARWSSIGFQFVISVLIGYYGGGWLDGKFGTDPWLSYIGIFLGMTASLYDMVVLTKKSVKALKDDASDD